MLKKLWERIKPANKEHVPETLPKCAVNYVWINNAAFVPDPENGKICGVPLVWLDNAAENAKKYKEAEFKVWLDYLLLDKNSLKMAVDHINGIDNLRVYDLKDAIGEYLNDPIFYEPKDIWARVDFAKILVCKHCFENTDAERVFFSDFDIEDIMLDRDVIHNSLDGAGVFFGATLEDGNVENSFLAFQKGAGEEFINEYLLPATHNDASFNLNGYVALQDSLNRWLDDGKSILPYHKLMYPMAHKTGIETSQNPDYERVNGDKVVEVKCSAEYTYLPL